MQQLYGLDSIMALGDMPNCPLHIGALFVYKPSATLTFDALRNLMLDALESHLPLLQCRIETVAFSIDRPYWVKDPEFNLDYHLQHYALPQPAGWTELHHLAATFHAEPLSRERPLWQALFIEGLDNLKGLPKGSVALLLKIHHSMCDGKTAMQLFASLHTLSPDPAAPLMVESMPVQHVDFSRPGLLGKYWHAYEQAVAAPYQLMKQLTAITPVLWRNRKKVRQQKVAHKAVHALFNRMPDADRVIGHIRLSRKRLKEMEAATGATINDIALCVVAGALRDYLQQHQLLPGEDLVAGMPINIRSDHDDLMMGNRMSYANLSLHTTVADPARRLRMIHLEASLVKTNVHCARAGSLLSLLDNLYPGLVVWAGKKLVTAGWLESLPPVNNTLVTNVPGIQHRCYLCGAELADYLGFGLLAPTLTLFHVISSVHSHVNISFLSCSGSLTDGEGYRRALAKSWEALQAAV